ncbi:hypothetical protein [Hymenobacter properus]|uniref:Uncharacterized protein n=1 Tax=Hymenobacter properus TaxID=2791026 RepID=A0A931BCS0_9BACT|nr:hypothetical protein [Hymenobacter properus]MBF9140288.1 hypothetical protein [Hymenobacter properus]MBR7719095.1 hypothetical protein [Microvirga sp. SRT04]
MPKLIDYPRTSYAGAWELAEVVDDTGGKCEIETAARKLNRKVSGSFKAIIGSAVKFGLLTSKRELLSTTTLFKRIKHAYDKKEELLFHREAFLTPPLFAQICRKFRLRELPVQMLDVMLIREFGVEEINAQGVAKAFVDGCRMVNLLDDRNTMADIDAAATQQQPRRELSSPVLTQSAFIPAQPGVGLLASTNGEAAKETSPDSPAYDNSFPNTPTANAPTGRKPTTDAIANLFGLFSDNEEPDHATTDAPLAQEYSSPAALTHAPAMQEVATSPTRTEPLSQPPVSTNTHAPVYQLQISGPGLNTTLSVLEEDDIIIAQALLEKIRRQIRAREQ